MIHNLSL